MDTQDCSFQVYKVLCSYSHCVFYYLQKLRDINHMLKQGGETSRKRALLQDDQSSHPPAKRTASEEVLQRKLTSMLEERQASASR